MHAAVCACPTGQPVQVLLQLRGQGREACVRVHAWMWVCTCPHERQQKQMAPRSRKGEQERSPRLFAASTWEQDLKKEMVMTMMRIIVIEKWLMFVEPLFCTRHGTKLSSCKSTFTPHNSCVQCCYYYPYTTEEESGVQRRQATSPGSSSLSVTTQDLDSLT